MLTNWLIGTLLVLVQALAALPWLWLVEPALVRNLFRRASSWLYVLLGLAGGGLVAGLVIQAIQSSERLAVAGRVYGAALQIQLSVDLFVGLCALLLVAWPKGGAVAVAAFREGVRQPLFWALAGFGSFLLIVSIFIPYFTFGDDQKFMKVIGFDLVMLLAAFFGVLAAALSITEEIEGRTAITLLSKPVSRRQFLVGKFAGILLAGLALTAILGWVFAWGYYFMPFLNPLDEPTDALQAQVEPVLMGLANSLVGDGPAGALLSGIALWSALSLAILLGLVTGFCQVMILTAVAAALATRLPLVVNLASCLALYFLGHLAPVLLQVAGRLQARFAAEHGGQSSVPLDLVRFMAQLFDHLLPALEYFNLGPAVIRDRPLPIGDYAIYTGSIALYSILYTAIALLLGLILFEDRDLA